MHAWQQRARVFATRTGCPLTTNWLRVSVRLITTATADEPQGGTMASSVVAACYAATTDAMLTRCFDDSGMSPSPAYRWRGCRYGLRYVGGSAAAEVPQVDHRVGQGFECVVH